MYTHNISNKNHYKICKKIIRGLFFLYLKISSLKIGIISFIYIIFYIEKKLKTIDEFVYFSCSRVNIARQLENIISICLHIFKEKKILYRMQFIRTNLLLF